jgi:hypothetical protein
MTPGSISTRLAALATVLAAIAATAGLAISGLYRDTPYWVEQARGTDLATLFVAVPILVLALWATHRGSTLGGLWVLGGLLYLVYNYGIFAFSVAMNPLTALYIGIAGVAFWSLVLGVPSAEIAYAGEAVARRLARRATAGLLIGVAALFGLLWVGQIATTTMGGVLPPDLVRAGIPTNPVYALDLAVFLPLCALAGIGLLRRNRAGHFALTMLVWVPLMGAGVIGGFVLAAVAGEDVLVAVPVLIGGLSVASAVLAVLPSARQAPERALKVIHHAVA